MKLIMNKFAELNTEKLPQVLVADFNQVQNNPIFIDCALAVTTYLLYTGLLVNNQEYIDYAVWMTTSMWDILYDADSGLIHQARGCKGHPEGFITEDCWSRGNGWMSMAFAKSVSQIISHKRTVEIHTIIG